MSINGGANSVNHKKKKKKKDIQSNPEIESKWNAERPKPQLTKNIWDEDDEDEIITYLDWHRRHPHCITPRPLVVSQDHLVGEQILDEENPQLFYTKNGIKLNPPERKFQLKSLGADCDVSTVSEVATEWEQMTRIQQHGDPWYSKSVRDEVEQSHIDGDSTTVKTKKAKKKKKSEFERQREWAEKLFHDYAGGCPIYPEELAKKMEKRALDDKSLLHAWKEDKKSIWEEEHEYSKFTANGSTLKEYKKVELSRKIDVAIQLHKDDLKTASFHPSSSSVSIMLKSRVLETQKTAMSVQDRMGSTAVRETTKQNIFKLVDDLSRYAKRRQKIIDTSLDVIEAVEHLRVAKLHYLLRLRLCDPNMMTPDDDNLFLHLLQKANNLDVISFHLHVGDYDKDSDDRKKMQRMLNLLLQYGVDVNTMVCRMRQAAIHIAASCDNCKMIVWLCAQNANLNLLSEVGNMTPLMYAVMFGFISASAALARCGAALDVVNDKGQTALHICAVYGQTRMAMFLLRLGASKHIRDANDRLPADVAAMNHFNSTEQAIASFSAIPPKVFDQLQYLADRKDGKPSSSPTNLKDRRRAASTPALSTSRSVGIFSSVVGGFLSFFGLTSKRDLEMAVACLEDDDKSDVTLSYGVEGSAQSWAGFQHSGANEDEDVMLLDQS